MTTRRIDELQPGDLVDLESDVFADPDYYASGDPTTSQHPEFQFEYAEVIEIERETPDCICVYFNASAFGFPPDHIVTIGGRITA